MSALNIFLTTWNTGLQGSKAQSQDLTSWLLPVLQGSSQNPDIPRGEIPDIYAIGIQELLPLHLACKLKIIAHIYLVREEADIAKWRVSLPQSFSHSPPGLNRSCPPMPNHSLPKRHLSDTFSSHASHTAALRYGCLVESRR